MMTPETGNGWYPRLARDGRIACGITEVFVGDGDGTTWTRLGPGAAPQWLDDRTLLCNEVEPAIGTVLYDVVTGTRTPIATGYNYRVAGALDWIGQSPGQPAQRYTGDQRIGPTPAGRWYLTMSPQNRTAWIDRRDQDIKTLHVDETPIVTGDIYGASLGESAIVWNQVTAKGRRTFILTPGGPQDISVEAWEDPHVVDTPDGPWVLSGTQSGIVLRPAGERFGYRRLGVFRDTHCRFVGGRFVVVSASNQGVFQALTIDLAEARVDLTATNEGTPIGPLGPETPVGVMVDCRPFFDVPDFARGNVAKGDTHPMHGVRQADGSLLSIKFGDGGQCEVHSIDRGFIHLQADTSVSGGFDRWPKDTRLMPVQMKTGLAHAWTSSATVLELFRRDCSGLVRSVGWIRKVWIRHWARWWHGADIGEAPCLMMIVDPTDDVYNDERYVEFQWRAEGHGWVSWGSEQSTVLFPDGDPMNPVFPVEPSIISDFYRTISSPAPAPRLPACIPQPTIPSDERDPVQIPQPVADEIRLFAKIYPPPQSDTPDEAHFNRCRVWIFCLAQQLRARFGPEWGTKSTSAGAPQTKDVVARQQGGQFDGWDVLTGAATGRPVLSQFGWYDLAGQFFIGVPGLDRIRRVSPRPRIRRDWIGRTSFDLGPRIEEGDRRWLDELKGYTVARIMVQTNYRGAPRSFAKGQQQLGPALAALASRTTQAEVTLMADTLEIGATRDQIRAHVAACNAILVQHASAVAGVEFGNETNLTYNQSPDFYDILFCEELDALIDTRFPVSWGGNMGGGSYVSYHVDRELTPEAAAVAMAALQQAIGKPVTDGEGLGIAEVGNTAGRQRTDDPRYGARQAKAAKANGVTGVVLHTDAGLSCRVEDLGPVQREASRLFLIEMGAGTPPADDPILDHALTTDGAGYTWFVNNWPKIQAAARAWHQKAKGNPASDNDLAHGAIWRATVEAPRWGTIRKALDDTWPGGAP